MNKLKQKILVVDDEKDVVELLKYNLIKNGYNVITASDGNEGFIKLNERPDLILLDVMMPRMNGYEFCIKIKNIPDYKNIPIIFLSAKTSEIDEMHGLNLGANDFIQKPISLNKIIARIKSNLRHSTQNGLNELSSDISIGPITLSREKFSVHVDKDEVGFVKKEFDLLYFLASNPGIVFSRERILTNVWGEDVCVVERTVDVHMLNIRKKLGKHSELIETIKGVGYRFKNVL
jgi:two-component system, OmpR family, alkaline phosphatase synthesis response regulator PhoP